MITRILVICSLLTSLTHARTWTSTSGKTLEGKWVRSNNKTITIRKPSGKTTTFKLSLLNTEDQAYAKQLAREAIHPLGWQPLTIELDGVHATLTAIGIPDAFTRIGARSWSATLPKGTWISIRFGSRYQYDRSHVFRWDGSPAIQFLRTDYKLFEKIDGKASRLVSIHVRQSMTHDKTALKELLKHKDIDSMDISGYQDYSSKVMLQLNPKALFLHGMSFNEQAYQQLSKLPRLKALTVSGQINQTKGLEQLKQLEALYLNKGIGSNKLTPLASLTNLRQLESRAGASIRNADWIKNLTKLKALKLNLNEAVDENAMLRHLPQLHTYSPAISGKATAETLSQMKNLTMLGYFGSRKGVKPTDLFPLKNITHASFFKSFDAHTLNQWRQQGGLRYLKKLNWSGDPSQLEGFSSLRHLATRVTQESDLDQFPRLTNLTIRLPFDKDHNFLDKLLAKQKSVINLSIAHGKATAIKELPPMPQVKVLKLDNFHQLTSLQGIEKSPALEVLILRNCKQVTDYANLKGNGKITLIETQ